MGSVYIRDISGHSAAIDSSGFLFVNVNGTLSVGNVNVSGNSVVISGQSVQLASGAAASMSGLNVTTTVNTTTNISGQIVFLTSGNNLVQLQSGSNNVTVSGFAAMSGVAVSVSGNFVSIVGGAAISGGNISGVAVSMSGNAFASGLWLASGINVLTSISGNVVLQSGAVSVQIQSGFNQVSVSGTVTTSVSGNVVSVSGNAIQFASGGSLALSGLAVTATVTTNISGNVIYTTSGQNLVQIASGYNQVIVSGFAAMSGVAVSVSGNAVSVSGNIIAISGQSVVLWGSASPNPGGVVAYTPNIDPQGQNSNSLYTIGFLHGWEPTQQAFVRIRTSISGAIGSANGNNFKLLAYVSGDPVTISGNTVIPVQGAPTMTSGFGFSGGIVTTPSMYDLSGANWVPLKTVTSGANSPLAVGVSPASKIRIGMSGTAIQSGVPSLSGGVALQSGDLYCITLRNLSGNAEMYVGGSGAFPYSGVGFPIGGGDAVTLSVNNANLVSVFATVSGQRIGWIGSQY